MAKRIPEYIDTRTPKLQWYGYNVFILLASTVMVGAASLILEHEIARLRQPAATFIASPLWLDLVLSSFILSLGLVNIAVLLFVFLRHLWPRRWMIATTASGWILLAVLALVLGRRFLPILLP